MRILELLAAETAGNPARTRARLHRMDVGLDPLDVRKHNLYGPDRYGMQVTHDILPELIDTLAPTATRRRADRSRTSTAGGPSSSAASR
jgi:hypothetical protein